VTTSDTLRGHELFGSLSLEEANRLSGFSAAKTYEANETVFEHNKLGTHVFMLMKGGVNLRLPSDPSHFGIIVSQVAVGELFGLSPLLDSPRYTTMAQCTEPSEILVIEAKPFRELLRGNCPVAVDVLNRVARIYFSRYLNILSNLQAVVNQIPLAQ